MPLLGVWRKTDGRVLWGNNGQWHRSECQWVPLRLSWSTRFFVQLFVNTGLGREDIKTHRVAYWGKNALVILIQNVLAAYSVATHFNLGPISLLHEFSYALLIGVWHRPKSLPVGDEAMATMATKCCTRDNDTPSSVVVSAYLTTNE